MCHGVCRQPPGTFVPSNTGSLAESEGGTALTGQNPAKGGVGSEGDLGEKEEEAEPHPWVPVARWERVGGGRAVVDSETAVKALIGGVLRWHCTAMVESVSTGRSVGCSWEG